MTTAYLHRVVGGPNKDQCLAAQLVHGTTVRLHLEFTVATQSAFSREVVYPERFIPVQIMGMVPENDKGDDWLIECVIRGPLDSPDPLWVDADRRCVITYNTHTRFGYMYPGRQLVMST